MNGLEGIEKTTLSRFILDEQRKNPAAQGDLTLLLSGVQTACKIIESCVRRAGIAQLYGLAGSGNVQGEDQKKLDILANDVFKEHVASTGKVCIMVSEEEDEPIIVDNAFGTAKYAIAFDPLDGSSNIDANVSIGTIFSIFRIPNPAEIKTAADATKAIMQPGSEMVVAGYCMFGSATNMVLTFNGGKVHGFTLDNTIGEFLMTHPNISIPKDCHIYSVNEGNLILWDEQTTTYINKVKNPGDGKKPYSARYIGSMVADVHRTLLYGGVFMYPADKKTANGKLRLLYEAAPMAMLLENAGGAASSGALNKRILDIVPSSIHQRVPVFMGSYNDINYINELYHPK
ncbi:Fructose-1,6-bisphosphatase, cytosolic [Porphyridium purpureum]|uniref:fructose-bisphosphatase n=1 Tax=Porphyridium purpureum TaxID=35688 RepID=A0A5J4YV61_PORPP|nr:Fructose-1,6-bisphosphatase, cytosolic [Porphyridium purpureum]|eukprot:POR7711..scf227_4